MDSTVGINPNRLNSLYDNPLTTRKHVQEAFVTLFEPLVSHFSDGGARVQIDASAAHFDRAAVDLEGFARPLWGIVPYVLGGGQFKHWDLYRKGLANGTDPDHPEYWGPIVRQNQRQVELAALGFALFFVPEHLWDPLSDKAKKDVGEYLIMGRNHNYPECNWKFFRVLVDLALKKFGVQDYDHLTEEALADVERYYLKDGWYIDGDPAHEYLRIDYYNPFALHLYGLIFSIAEPDHPFTARYRERAAKHAHQYINFFGEDGAIAPYGRSLTYRFACGSFWGGLAFADLEALPWGVIKGLFLRHLRWWAKKPIMRLDEGLLTVGYGYPNPLMTESYNSSNSPYWAMKMFIALAVPEDHPFWTAEEQPLPLSKEPVVMDVPGMVSQQFPGNTTVLVAGPERKDMPLVAEKYNKFAYSTRYGFSIEYDYRNFSNCVFDSMIAFSDDNSHYRVRERCTVAKFARSTLYCEWTPFKDVKVSTWLIPSGQWHIRVHKIEAESDYSTLEGGFAIPEDEGGIRDYETKPRSAWVSGTTLGYDFSGIVDLSPSPRKARVHVPQGNTNLHNSKTTIPQLLGTVKGGETTVFIGAITAGPVGSKEAWAKPPAVPKLEDLEKLIAEEGELVGIWKSQQEREKKLKDSA